MKLPLTPVEKFEGWSLIDADGVEIASGMAAGRDMGESDAKQICTAVNNFRDRIYPPIDSELHQMD